MLILLKIYSKLLKVFVSLLFCLQLLLMLLVLLIAMHWFTSLLESHIFDFMAPAAEFIKDFMKVFYDKTIDIGGVVVDGTLLLFCMLGIPFAMCINKFRYFIQSHIEYVKNQIYVYNIKKEDEFNKQLENELKVLLSKLNKAAILLSFDVCNMLRYSSRNDNDIKIKKEEAYNEFFESLKVLKNCKFEKKQDKLLILIDEIELLDSTLAYIYFSLETIRNKFKKDSWSLKSYIAIDIYDTKEKFENITYKYLEKMLILHHENEAVCLGNLKLKYEFEDIKTFFVFKKGTYDIIGESEVYVIVKKD